MIHVRIDDEELNSKRKMACGIGPELPPGDKLFFRDEDAAERHATCPACREALGWSREPRRLGTPLSQLSGRPGHPGYAEFCRIARSWGYE